MPIKKIIINIAKIVIAVLSFGFIYFKIKNELSEHKLSDIFNGVSDYKFLIIVILLMFINWGIETIKWQKLIRCLEPIPFKQAIKGVLAGVSVSIFTPNRIGDFGGRILALKPENRVSGVFATLLGSLAQLLTTILFGLCFLPMYIYSDTNINVPTNFNYNLLLITSLTLCILGLIVFFNPKYITMVFKKQKWFKFVDFISRYSKKDMFNVLILSIIRYIVFFTQYHLLLLFFNVDITLLQSLCGISLIYLLTNLIPVLSFFEFGVRGSLAIIILGIYTPFSVSLLYASLLLWFINLAVPALAGIFFMFRLNSQEAS